MATDKADKSTGQLDFFSSEQNIMVSALDAWQKSLLRMQSKFPKDSGGYSAFQADVNACSALRQKVAGMKVGG